MLTEKLRQKSLVATLQINKNIRIDHIECDNIIGTKKRGWEICLVLKIRKIKGFCYVNLYVDQQEKINQDIYQCAETSHDTEKIKWFALLDSNFFIEKLECQCLQFIETYEQCKYDQEH